MADIVKGRDYLFVDEEDSLSISIIGDADDSGSGTVLMQQRQVTKVPIRQVTQTISERFTSEKLGIEVLEPELRPTPKIEIPRIAQTAISRIVKTNKLTMPCGIKGAEGYCTSCQYCKFCKHLQAKR